MKTVRTRYAPSPTGLQHLGGVRTALFNWLWAKHNKGEFILRLEDTDIKRQIPEAESHIEDTLSWLGITPDEGPTHTGKFGPYRQSERLEIYQKFAARLLKTGRLYRDWTTPDQLAHMRQKAAAAKQPFRVRKTMLNTTGDKTLPHVLRFQIDTKGNTIWEDEVHGTQSWHNSELDDFVAVKSDGFPTYNFANVIDDHLMQISHVLRGDEFLASTPKHLQIYAALEIKPPVFAHLPAVLGIDKTKLSKRHGALDALEYQKLGYLPEAIVNFLALLGWHPGDEQELLSTKDLIKKFSLGRLHASPAVFDPERLNWLNGVYIRDFDLKTLYPKVENYWPEAAKKATAAYKLKVLGLVHKRLKFLAELKSLTEYFFVQPKISKATLLNSGQSNAVLKGWLNKTIDVLKSTQFNQESLEKTLRQLMEKLNAKPANYLGGLRWIITNQPASPGLFETLEVLGKDETLARLERALKLL